MILFLNQVHIVASQPYSKIFKYFSGDTNISFFVELEQNMKNNFCSITIFLRQSALPDMKNIKNNDDYAVCQFAYQEEQVCRVRILNPMVDTWYYLSVISNCFYKINIKSLEYKCLKHYGKKKEHQTDDLVIHFIIPFISVIRFYRIISDW